MTFNPFRRTFLKGVLASLTGLIGLKGAGKVAAHEHRKPWTVEATWMIRWQDEAGKVHFHPCKILGLSNSTIEIMPDETIPAGVECWLEFSGRTEA